MARTKRIILLVLLAVFLLQCLFMAAYFINRKAEEASYRLAYESLIEEYAEEYALDAFLVAAVIHVESRGDPDAVSPKGACGLMQIMPDTGKWIYGKLDGAEEDFSQRILFSPRTNIRYGCWYLRYLLDKFAQNTEYALAAYNAGPGNLESWLEDANYAPAGKLETIPFAQTEAYVKNVKHAKEKYEELYANKAF